MVFFNHTFMLTFEQMALRLLAAIALGALLGWEREIIHKEAGVRTSMLVGAGASIFTMIGLTLPYLVGSPEASVAASNGAMGVIANVVVGIGFLGAGLIVKSGGRVHSLTTAAVVWAVAAIGILCGIGLFKMAAFAAVLLTILLYLLRNLRPKGNGLEIAAKPRGDA
jgi:putative Mg2+ transporter-C (MgtC) family protein